MLNFRGLVEFFFKSFDISGDTKLLRRLGEEGNLYMMFIKRHWAFGVINSWRVLFVIIITFVNVYLLLFDGSETLLSVLIGIFLIGNVVVWVYIIYKYIMRFYNLQGSKPQVEDIYDILRKAQISDDIFTSFFNQTIFISIISIVIAGFISVTAITNLLTGGATGLGVGTINLLLIIVQLILFYSYLSNMINQEMDFFIVTNGRLYFYNQKGVLGESQNMEAEKIKTMNTSYPGLFSSLLNFGNIKVLSEGTTMGEGGEMHMGYIGDPKNTVDYMWKTLTGDLEGIAENINVVFNKLRLELGDINIDDPKNMTKIKRFLEKNDKLIQESYKVANQDIQTKIKKLYSLVQ